jgi:hypothetical protein
MATFSATLLLLAAIPAAAKLSQPTPELIRVNPHVYCAAGYALGNVIFVLTETSVVVVDTTERQASARAASTISARFPRCPSLISFTPTSMAIMSTAPKSSRRLTPGSSPNRTTLRRCANIA